MNIYLAGSIGAGKTTVGKQLAEQLGWDFRDLDPAMELDAGKDFRQVVAEEGWLGFRQREYRICKGFRRLGPDSGGPEGRHRALRMRPTDFQSGFLSLRILPPCGGCAYRGVDDRAPGASKIHAGKASRIRLIASRAARVLRTLRHPAYLFAPELAGDD